MKRLRSISYYLEHRVRHRMKDDRKRQKKHTPRKGKTSLVGQPIDFDISDMAYGGQALGKYRGKLVFVPYTLPGEAVTAEITHESGSVAFARGTHLRAASVDRVAPRCPHFGPGRCWGCHWQHIDYPAQLLLKQDVLADQLSRVGKLPDRIIDRVMRPFLPAARIWQFNQRLTLLRDENGAWGYRRQHKGGIEGISECHLAHTDLIDTLAELDLDFERARRLTLQRDSDGRIMLILEVYAEEAPSLHTDLPISVNLILPDNVPINLVGSAQSHFRIAGREFRVTAGASIRPNVDQVAALVTEVMKALRLTGHERVLDLYAGVGIFSAFIAANAALVTIVESYPPAATDADVNLADFDQVDIIEGQVEAALSDMVAVDAEYDIALVDPPSSGLGQSVIADLARLTIQRLVYVSGDPPSLARDCNALFKAGFHLREIQPVDMAPHTYFITAVARFER